MLFFDPLYLLYLAPVMLFAWWAQNKVRSAYAEASRVPARMNGASAARYVQQGCITFGLSLSPAN